MNSSDLRTSFLEFFESKGHTIVPSASLLPTSPNLLFTNAGMNQFVPYFLGERVPVHRRIADTQKCIRAGGKHNDLEDVGFDSYHHTFFEMLGNWSLGDYFKAEALRWSWELLTQVWGMPKERLYVTVYDPAPGAPAEFDHEAWEIWAEILSADGLDPHLHIKKNPDCFWMMGDTGPCGPCSEMHLDTTEANDTNGALVDANSPYCMELWNNVFIQFNALEDGSFVPLKERHVDTGLGFERVAGIMATSKGFSNYSLPPSNYDSDLFTDLFDFLSGLCDHRYQQTIPDDRDHMNEVETKDCAFRVLADHARTLCCAIADGILPGNEGRNYVLRRILRRGVLWANRLNLRAGSLEKLVGPVVEKLGPVFPELSQQVDVIERVIASEEAAFERTIDRGLVMLDRLTDEASSEISGKDAFTLYDTHGFPLDLTQMVARERELTVDTEGFSQEMEQQRERARAGQKRIAVTVVDSDTDAKGSTRFVGYEADHLSNVEARITDIVYDRDKIFLVTDRTPFYAELGGQIGDRGSATVEGRELRISNTVYDVGGRCLHELASAPEIGSDWKPRSASISLSVDEGRRREIQRHHTATHVLHWALREVLGRHVRQAGSLVSQSRLRFDFSHFEQPSANQMREIETLANERAIENAGVTWFEVPFHEKPDDSLAFFGDKYGDIVRVVDIGGWSRELCGGTHVTATGEIGLIKVVGESAIAAGIRRIEAVVGATSLQLVEENFGLVQRFAQRLSCSVSELDQRFGNLLQQKGNLEKEIRGFRKKDVTELANLLATRASNRSGIPWMAKSVNLPDPGEMRNLAVQLSRKFDEHVIILGGVFKGKVNVLALCSEKAIASGFQAGNLVREITQRLGGNGGGKPDFAMGGGPDAGNLDAVLEDI